MTSRHRFWAGALVLSAVSGLAHAESLEQRFRGFLDRLRSAGEAIVAAPLKGLTEARKPEMFDRTDQLPLGTGEYAIFVGPGCRSCDQAVAHMKSRKLAFSVLDVSRSDAARQSYSLLHTQGLPVVLMPHQMLVGFDPKTFQQAFLRDQQLATQVHD